MDIDPTAKRASRRDLTRLTHPQRGVDDMADDFPDATPIPGVVDVRRPRER